MRGLWTISACLVILSTSVHSLGAEEGLVVHYTFDEGTGEVVRDKSGNGFDGRIVHAKRSGVSQKAEWVREKDRKVLRLGGWAHVEVGTKVNAMMGQSGTLEAWCLPEEIGGGLISWHTGPNWPDQRLVLSFITYKASQLGGWISDGVQNTRNALRHTVEKGKWHHFVMTFGDGEPPSLRLFVNGEQVSTLPQMVSPNIQDVPLCVGRNVGLGKLDFLGRMAEARVYNRALSADEVNRHFIEGVKRLGIEVPASLRVTPRFDARKAELTLLCDLARVFSLPRRPSLSVLLRDVNKKVLRKKTVEIPLNTDIVPVTFPTASLTAGLYEVLAAVKDMQTDKDIVEPTTVRWYLPEVGQLVGVPPGRKILNNLVAQLTTVDNLDLKPYQEVPFVNPRKGWVFVSTTAQVPRRGLITVAVDAEKKYDSVVAHCTANKPATEVMRLLSAGEHKLRIWFDPYSINYIVPASEKQAAITRLVVRAVPAMVYCSWPGGCHVGGYTEPWGGLYGFAFLKKDVLPNINTLVGVAATNVDPERAEWRRRGGQCLLENNLPHLVRKYLKDAPNPLTADYAYNYWTKGPGFTHPYFDGVMADEVSPGDNNPDYRAYAEAVKRIAANPDFKDKAVHMFGGAEAMCAPSLAADCARAAVDSGYKLAPNTYLAEAPTVEKARALFEMEIRRPMERGAEAYPGFPRHVIMNLSFMSVPPHTCNLNPHVDYKVFLDMQFQHLATSPECFGLWGVMMYKSTYAEEEAIRWVGRLFRHYCIQGNTDLLSEQYGFTYNLRHIRNADFDEGLTGWQVAAAEPESVKTGHMRGLPSIFSRYHHANEGSNFVLMKRSARKPNRVSQEIVGLQAGRFYSMKMFVADHQDLVQGKSEKKLLTVSVNIENVEMIPAKSVASAVRSYYAIAQYAGKTPPYMNYHRYVFRAKGPTARLTISDWADGETPGGPIGQETLMNFIEIQPYLND